MDPANPPTLSICCGIPRGPKSGASAVVKGAKQLVTKPPSRAEMKRLAGDVCNGRLIVVLCGGRRRDLPPARKPRAAVGRKSRHPEYLFCEGNGIFHAVRGRSLPPCELLWSPAPVRPSGCGLKRNTQGAESGRAPVRADYHTAKPVGGICIFPGKVHSVRLLQRRSTSGTNKPSWIPYA